MGTTEEVVVLLEDDDEPTCSIVSTNGVQRHKRNKVSLVSVFLLSFSSSSGLVCGLVWFDLTKTWFRKTVFRQEKYFLL